MAENNKNITISPLIWNLLMVKVLNEIAFIKKSKASILNVDSDMAKILVKDEIMSLTREKNQQTAFQTFFAKSFINILNSLKGKDFSKMTYPEFLKFVEDDLFEKKTRKHIIDEYITEVFFLEFQNRIDDEKINNAMKIFLDKNSTVIYNYITNQINTKNIINKSTNNSYNPINRIWMSLYQKNLEFKEVSRNIQENNKIFNIEDKSKLNLANVNIAVYDFVKEARKFIAETLPNLDNFFVPNNSNLEPKVIMLNMSDFHFNETCYHRSRPEFNWTPSRAIETLNKLIDYLQKEVMPKYNVKEIKILALGDLVWYWIHDQIKKDMEIWPDTSRTIMQLCLSQMILYINKNFAPTEMILVPWNHAEKRDWKERPLKWWEENYDSLLWRDIMSFLNNFWMSSKLIMPKGDEKWVYKSIWWKGFAFSHWDVPIWKGLAHSDSQYKWPSIDYSLIWHWHHPEIRRKEANLIEYIMPNTNLPDEYTVMGWFSRSTYHNWACLIVNSMTGEIEEYNNFDIEKYDNINVVKFNFAKLFENEHLRLENEIKEQYWMKIIKDNRINNPLKINKNTVHSKTSLIDEITKKVSVWKTVKISLVKEKFIQNLQNAFVENKLDIKVMNQLEEIKDRLTKDCFEIRKEWKKFYFSINSKMYVYSDKLGWIAMLEMKKKTKYIYDTLSNSLYEFDESWKHLVELKWQSVPEFIKEKWLIWVPLKEYKSEFDSLKELSENKEFHNALQGLNKWFLVDYPDIFIETKEELSMNLDFDVNSLFEV